MTQWLTDKMVDIKEKYCRFQPWIRNTIYYQNRLYFIAGNYNALFSIDVENGDMTVEYSLPEEAIDCMNLGNLYRMTQFLVLAPFHAKHLFVWDLEKKKEIFIKNCTDDKEWNGFAMATVTGQSVYLWPVINRHPCKIDLGNTSVKKINLCIDCEKYNINFINCGWYEYEKKIYFVSCDASSMIEFSLETEISKCYALGLAGSKIISLTGMDDILYLLSEDKKLILWNISKSSIQKQISFSYVRDDLRQLYENVCDGDYIYFLSRDTDGSWGIRYNRITEEVYVNSLSNFWNLQIEKGADIHYSSCDDSGNMYLFSSDDNMYVFNLMSKQARKIPLKVPYVDIRNMFWNYKVKNTREVIPETEYWDIRDLLKLSRVNMMENRNKCGINIYEVIG